jgi:hypothetical protein
MLNVALFYSGPFMLDELKAHAVDLQQKLTGLRGYL